jgi:hypothetical protein
MLTAKYNIAYDDITTGATRTYCVEWMPRAVAEIYLAKFVARYVGKPYPNGRGHYPFVNARIIRQD